MEEKLEAAYHQILSRFCIPTQLLIAASSEFALKLLFMAPSGSFGLESVNLNTKVRRFLPVWLPLPTVGLGPSQAGQGLPITQNWDWAPGSSQGTAPPSLSTPKLQPVTPSPSKRMIDSQEWHCWCFPDRNTAQAGYPTFARAGKPTGSEMLFTKPTDKLFFSFSFQTVLKKCK